MEFENVEYKVGSVAQWWRAHLDGGHKALGSICWTLLHVYACSLACLHARTQAYTHTLKTQKQRAEQQLPGCGGTKTGRYRSEDTNFQVVMMPRSKWLTFNTGLDLVISYWILEIC